MGSRSERVVGGKEVRLPQRESEDGYGGTGETLWSKHRITHIKDS
jgi:hypothetical protein